jgi:hypothetical protein
MTTEETLIPQDNHKLYSAAIFKCAEEGYDLYYEVNT